MHIPLLVGCPVLGREWIVDDWIAHTERACEVAGVVPSYLFLGDANDVAVERLAKKLLSLDREVFLVHRVEEDHNYKRIWNASRYHVMVEIRNRLLAKVREISPAFFLSLDSDILLHEEAIARMSHMDYDAVGSRTYMTTPPPQNSRQSGTSSPSFYVIRDGRPKRWDHRDVMEVDVIMAIKLMGPRAYNIDYEFHSYGEDVGWSIACKRSGLRLGWNGVVASKHVMNEKLLSRVDQRCGF